MDHLAAMAPPQRMAGRYSALPLWRDCAGDITISTSNGAGFTRKTYGNVGVVDTHWQVAQIGDCSGEEKADILWRNADADVYTIWMFNGRL